MQWIVVADNGRARFFAVQDQNTLSEVDDLVHPEGQLAGRERVSAPSGRRGVQGGGMSHDRDEAQSRAFARSIAQRAKQGVDGGDCVSLVLVAPPRFLGRLRDAFDGSLGAKVVQTVNKDFTQVRTHDLPAALTKAGLSLA